MKKNLFCKRGNVIMAAVLSVAIIMSNSMFVCAEEIFDDGIYEDENFDDGYITSEEFFNGVSSDVASDVDDTKDVSADLESVSEYVKTLDAGEDYVENEILFFADDKSNAESIASEYNGRLISFENGIGRAYVQDGVTGSIDAALTSNTQTMVYPNYIRHICSGKTIKLDEIPAFKNSFESCLTTASSNDPFIAKGWQWHHEAVHSLEARSLGYTGKGVIVAVLDTGVSLNHDELKDHIRKTKSYYGSSVEDDNGHGTHCAGLIAAEADNNIGGSGIAPNVTLDIYKIADSDGSLQDSDAAAALQLAVENGANVVSMSFGGPNSTSILDECVKKAYEAGVTCVASAGNDSKGFSYYPGGSRYAISIGASSRLNSTELASYSNYGENVDIVTPGGSGKYRRNIILSQNGVTMNDLGDMSADAILSSYKDNGYALLSGTSMATPIAAGIVALLYEKYKDTLTHNHFTCDMIRNIVLNSTDEQIYKSAYGSVNGLLLADKALLNENYNNNSSNYVISDATGLNGLWINTYIMAGKSVNLYVAPLEYDFTLLKFNKYVKKLSKQATWTSDSPYIKVKNGKIKCKKTAPAGSVANITAKIDGETLTAHVMVLDPIYKIGTCVSGNDFTTKTNINLHMLQGYDLDNPALLMKDVGLNLVALHAPKSSNVGYGNTEGMRYLFKLNKKQEKLLFSRDDGDSKKIYFSLPGKYKFTYKLPYGCNKKFTVNVDVSL